MPELIFTNHGGKNTEIRTKGHQNHGGLNGWFENAGKALGTSDDRDGTGV